MNEEKDFDDIFRSKFEEQSFPFDEGNWDEAEEMIERQRRKEKRRRRFFLFFIGILTGIGIVLPFLYNWNYSVAEEKVNAKQKEKELTQNQNDQDLKNQFDESASISIDTSQSSHTIKPNENKPTLHTSFQKENKKNNGDYKNSDTKGKDELNAQKEQKSKSETAKLKEKDTKNSNHSSNTQIGSVQNQNSAEKGNESKNEISKNGDESSNEIQENNTDSTITLAGDSNDGIIVPEKSDSTNTVIHDSLVSANQDSTLAVQDTAQGEDSQEETQLAPAFIKTNTWGIFIGGNYHLGWNYNDTIDGKGITPAIGLNYEFNFKPNSSISFGLVYQYTGNLNYHYQQTVSHHPGFGLNDSINRYKVEKLHYVILPFQYLFIAGKNKFGIGASFSYLLHSSNSITSFIKTETGAVEIAENKGKNYWEGFNRMDISLNLSYRRKLGNRLDLTSDFNYGLLDQKSDNGFTNSISMMERNIYFRAGLIFKIFTK